MNILTNLKEFVKRYEDEIILAIGVALISLLSFAAGFLVAKEQSKSSISIIEDNQAKEESPK